MMKRDRRLHQSLKMEFEIGVRWSLSPDIFESLVGLEETLPVEQSEALMPTISHNSLTIEGRRSEAPDTVSHIKS
jgi:hypothetical protein